jgi:hypothetical protein
MCVERIPHTLESKEIQRSGSEEGWSDPKRGAGMHVIIIMECETFFARSATVKKVHENGPGGADRIVQWPAFCRGISVIVASLPFVEIGKGR